MVAIGSWVDAEIHGPGGCGAGAQFATIVHGDYKAMNTFVPCQQPARGAEDSEDPLEDSGDRAGSASHVGRGEAVNDAVGATMIDFQWTGVGLAMSDVAMHLHHSVDVRLLDDGGEAYWVGIYYARLLELLAPKAAAAYPFNIAERHYDLCLLDYGRVVISHFWKGLTPAAFVAKNSNLNCSMVYRTIPCALRFASALEHRLTRFETERAGEHAL